MHLHLQSPPPRFRRAGELSPLAMTAVLHGLTADQVETMGRAFLTTAAELRLAQTEAGHA